MPLEVEGDVDLEHLLAGPEHLAGLGHATPGKHLLKAPIRHGSPDQRLVGVEHLDPVPIDEGVKSKISSAKRRQGLQRRIPGGQRFHGLGQG